MLPQRKSLSPGTCPIMDWENPWETQAARFQNRYGCSWPFFIMCLALSVGRQKTFSNDVFTRSAGEKKRLDRQTYLAPNYLSKGQLISKADWRAIDSPKKGTDEFVLFAFLLFTANKSNSSVCFWENLRCANLLFGFSWPLPCQHDRDVTKCSCY